MADNTERLVIEINKDLKRRFKEKVESEGRSMKHYVSNWIKDYTYGKKELK